MIGSGVAGFVEVVCSARIRVGIVLYPGGGILHVVTVGRRRIRRLRVRGVAMVGVGGGGRTEVRKVVMLQMSVMWEGWHH